MSHSFLVICEASIGHMEEIYTSMFTSLFIFYFIFHPIDHFKMIIDMSSDYNKVIIHAI